MRLPSNSIWSAYLVACFAAGAAGASGQHPTTSISGPILGFIEDASGTAIRPILGVLGASIIGQPLELGSRIRNAVMSPAQDYAIAVRDKDGEVVMIRLDSRSIIFGAIQGVRPGADVIAVSPSGTAAAMYRHEDKVLQSVRTLRGMPEVVFELDVSDISGRLQALALADDGLMALLNFTDGDTAVLWVVHATGSRWPLASHRPSAAAFFKHSYDAVVADDAAEEVFLVLGLDQLATRTPLLWGAEFAGVSGVIASDDGQKVFITSKDSEAVTMVDLATGLSSVIPCHCQTTGFQRLSPGIVRLNDLSGGPIALLDASTAEPRVLLIPAAPISPPGESEQVEFQKDSQ